MGFTRERRQELIQAIDDITAEEARVLAGAAPGGRARLDELLAQGIPLARALRAEMPMLAMSRCPFCGFIAEQAFDPYGIDGFWWRGPTARRGSGAPPRCPHYFCFTGALALARPVEVLPFDVTPGPEVPFVVPSILEHPGMRVVMSSTPVGRHTGYPIFYYGDPIIPETTGLNDWGHTQRFAYRDGKCVGWSSRNLLDEECDFDLAPWIARGKVQYILPGDETLTLRSTVEGCPYLDLPGRRVHNRIYRGELWPKLEEPSSGT